MCSDKNPGTRVIAGSRPEIPVWCMGWLFTIGYLKLAFWKAVLAIVIWPYYIGVAVR